MKLFNQTDKTIVYDDVKPHLVWEPFASLEVSSIISEHLRAVRFPVGPHEYVKPEPTPDPVEALQAELAALKSSDAAKALADEQAAHADTKAKLAKAVEALKKLKADGS